MTPRPHRPVRAAGLAVLAIAATVTAGTDFPDPPRPVGVAPSPFGVPVEGVLAADLIVAAHRESEASRANHRWPPAEGDDRSRDSHARRAKENVYPPITPAWPGVQRLEAGHVRRQLRGSNLNHSFVAGSDLVTEIGTMRGAFLARGIVFGDEAGIWSQPFKMLDGILVETRVDGGPWRPMNGVAEFVNRMHAVEFLDQVDGLRRIRRDVPATGIAAFLHRIGVTNATDRELPVGIRLVVQANVRPMWHKPWSVAHGEDEIREASPGRLVAWDPRIPGIRVAFGTAGDAGPPDSVQTDVSNPFRVRGILLWETTLAPGRGLAVDLATVQWSAARATGSPEVPFAGDPDAEALAMLESTLARIDAIEESRRSWMEERVFGGVRFECPEPDLEDAFACARYNLATLHADFRPYFPHPHLATCPERGYQLLFGIDTLYASTGATAAGLGGIVRDTLLDHLHFAAQTGNREIHYYVDHFGRHGDRLGRAQESAQFLGTFWNHVRLTGDLALARESWPALRALLDGVAARDRNGDGWPEGMTFPGLTREAGADTMLDAAVRAWWATDAMARLALRLGEPEAEALARRALAMRARFVRDWWLDAESTWAIGLAIQEDGTTAPLALEGHHGRSLHYPQAYGIADPEQGRRSLDRIASEAVDALGGYHAPASTVWQNSLLALGAFRYDRPELAMRLLRRAADNPIRLEKMLGGFSTLNTHPDHPSPNWNKLMYNWGAGPFLEAILLGMMGIDGDATAGTLALRPRVPSTWQRCAVRGFRLGEHELDLVLEGPSWTLSVVGGPGGLAVTLPSAPAPVRLGPGDATSFPRTPFP